MKFFNVLCLLLLSISSSSQHLNGTPIFDNQPVNPNLINLIKKKLPKKPSVQINFWFYNGSNFIVREDYLLSISFTKKKWKTQTFTFIDTYSKNIRVRETLPAVEFTDSIFKSILNDSLLYFQSWTLLRITDTLIKRGSGLHWISEGGINYTIEFIASPQRKKIVINCPWYFVSKGLMPELNKPLIIITRFLSFFKKERPC